MNKHVFFPSHNADSIKQSFFKTVAQALTDFSELNPLAPIQLLFESLNEEKQLSGSQIACILPNIACYFDCVPQDLGSQDKTMWPNLLNQMEIFFNKLILILPSLNNSTVHANSRSILDPFCKTLIFILQHWNFEYKYLVEVCHLAYRTFVKVQSTHQFFQFTFLGIHSPIPVFAGSREVYADQGSC